MYTHIIHAYVWVCEGAETVYVYHYYQLMLQVNTFYTNQKRCVLKSNKRTLLDSETERRLHIVFNSSS